MNRKRLVFIDDSGSNTAMAREYGRAPSGERVEDDKPYNHGENVSLVGALGLGGLRTLMTLGGAPEALMPAAGTALLVAILPAASALAAPRIRLGR